MARQKNSPPTYGFPGPAMFSVETQNGNACWPSLTFTKYCSMTVDIKRMVVDSNGFEQLELMHNLTITYGLTGPKLLRCSNCRIPTFSFTLEAFTKYVWVRAHTCTATIRNGFANGPLCPHSHFYAACTSRHQSSMVPKALKFATLQKKMALGLESSCSF